MATSGKTTRQVEAWANELIDLTKRNTSLYYKPLKRGSLQIIAPAPVEVLARLQHDDAWYFIHPPAGSDAQQRWTVEDSVAVRRPHELVTERLTPSDLDLTLKNIARVAALDLADRGLESLYLAFGMLHWRGKEDDEEHRSPILFVPVQLVRPSPREAFRLIRLENDPVVNLSLRVLLEQEFGLLLPDLEPGQTQDLELGDLLDAVTAAVRRRGWSVEPTVTLKRATFHKEAMYRDLTGNLEQIAEHQMVRALASDDVAPQGDPPTERELDRLAPPEDAAIILDADGSQRRAIAAARDGISFVMDGPPGTGKSQTIANVIAQLVADGRSVLFVSEKLAALQVVASRLSDRGLSPFLLELHGQKVGRREVAKRLGEALRKRPVGDPQLNASDLARAKQLRVRLSGYTEALNRRREPLGRSVEEIAGRLAQLHSAPIAPLPSSVDSTLSADKAGQLLERFQQLGRVWSPVSERANFVWRGLRPEHAEPNSTPELRQLAEQLQRWLGQVLDLGDQLADETGLPVPRQLASAEVLVAVAAYAAEQPLTERHWWSSPQLGDALVRVGELRITQTERRQDIEYLSERYGSAWSDLPVDGSEPLRRRQADVVSLGVATPAATLPELEAQLAALRSTEQLLEHIAVELRPITAALGAPPRERTLDEAAELAHVAARSDATHRPEQAWASPAVAERVEAALGVLAPLIDRYRSRRAALDEVFTSEVEQLPLKDLVVRFEQRHRGLRKLTSAYRQDKHTVATATRVGKATKEVRAQLREALELQESGQQLDEAHEQARALLSSYAQQRDTDAGAASQAVDVVRDAVRRLGEDYNPAAIAQQLCGSSPADPMLADRGARLLTRITEWANGPALLLSLETTRSLEALRAGVGRTLPAFTSLVEEVRPLLARRGSTCDVPTLFGELDRRSAIDHRETRLRDREDDDRSLFGEQYCGMDTAVDAVEQGLRWTLELQAHFGGPLPERAGVQLHTRQPPADPEPLRQACGQARKLQSALLGRFDDERQIELAPDLDDELGHGVLLCQDLLDRIGQIDAWRQHVWLMEELRSDGWSATLDFTVEERLTAAELRVTLERALWTSWFNASVRSDRALKEHRAEDLEADLTEFRAVDHQLLDDAAQRVAQACARRRPVTTVGQAKIIEKESQKKSRHLPVRMLLDRTAAVTQALKPCFLMSPLTVSEFLPSTFHFDVVIFDEASQVTPADAINCVYRAGQLIVAGDDKQLPPTNFFARAAGSDEEAYDEDQLDEFESVLGLCRGTAGMHSIPLQWHYRSQHEALIDFSNHAFYDSNLVTFPAATLTGSNLGVAFHFVDGTYRSGSRRDNPVEADAVAARIIERAATAPDRSVGVVTFSQAQADAVADAVDQARLDRPDLDQFFEQSGPDAFFIKALENVQGDERDEIVFSVGYGPTETGAISANFGPLNRKGGERRLNVAVTRARRKVELFASFQPEALEAKAQAEGLRQLLAYMRYARAQTERTSSANGVQQADAALAAEVAAVVEKLGFEVDLGVGMGSYRVDVAVRDPDGGYLLGLELDGAAHAAAPVARDRDRLRQEVLGRLGWRIERVWGPAFVQDRAGFVERIRQELARASAGAPPPLIPARSATIELSAEEVDLDAAPGWTLPYEVAPVHANPRHHPADASAMSELATLISRIAQVEAPITLELLLARVSELYGVNGTRRVREAVLRAVTTLVRREAFRLADGTLLGSSDQVAVRVPTTDPRTQRSIDEIPNRELEAAVTALLRDARGLHLEELTTAVARIFGFKRTGAKIRQAIEDAVHRLTSNGVVAQRRDGTLQVGAVELPDEAVQRSSDQLFELIREGEHNHLEFKATLRTSVSDGSVMKELEKTVAKTVAGFLNADGGTLLIGVTDGGDVHGIEQDYASLGRKQDRDGWELHLANLLKNSLGTPALPRIALSFYKLTEHDVCRVDVRRSSEPVYVREGRAAPQFFARMGNSTQPLNVEEAQRYITNHWG